MTPKIALVRSNPVELSNFMALESHVDAAEFVTQNSLKEHLQAFSDPSIIYLTVEKQETGSRMAGFILLALADDGEGVELRRIVIDNKENGVGQMAMELLERYVREEIGRSRIWLDVFTNNHRALHIYQKLGYRQFDTAEYSDGRPLLMFEKGLSG